MALPLLINVLHTAGFIYLLYVLFQWAGSR